MTDPGPNAGAFADETTTSARRAALRVIVSPGGVAVIVVARSAISKRR